MSIEYLAKQLGANEKIQYESRQHWVFLVTRIFWGVAIAAIIFVLVLLLDTSWATDVSWIPWLYLLALIPLVQVLWRVLLWRARVYVVTNRRVARVAGVLNKNVKDSSLEKVNDVILAQSMFGRLLGYGTIEILTASEQGLNLMKMLRDPVTFKTAMVNAKESFEHEFGHSS
jgi:uncharacterized membrane protein YdbT with pleckstrin-like domain